MSSDLIYSAILTYFDAHYIEMKSILAEISSVSSKELFDESDHLWFLDSSWVVLVEGGEHLIEGFLGELVTGSEVTEGVLNELLGLFLVESSGLVDIIGVPDLVDNTLNGLFFSWHCFWKCLVNN